MENKPAGWYRNSDDRRQHGYWDGLAWDQPIDDAATPQSDLDVPDEPEAAAAAKD